MQAALAKGLGCEKKDIQIDYDAKTASVDLGGEKPDMAAVAKVMDEGGQYKATLVE